MLFRLLQARLPGDQAAADERLSFALRLGVPVDQVEPFDLLTGESTPQAVIEGVDALLVGGSGHFSVNGSEPWVKVFIDAMGAVAEQGFPTFASCFGFQALVVALGGEVIQDAAAAEVGSFTIELAEAASLDPLFGQLPPSFVAQLGHKDRALRLPGGVVHLASSERCPYQAFRLEGKPVYATQFHPELTGPENRERFRRYYKGYEKAFGEGEARSILESFEDSPEAETLLEKYVERILGPMAAGS
jgi:GMP synthase (glutamine-hydrolysing)